jgi:dihydrofolate reductase
VTRLRCQLSVSLDGYLAGPNPSEEHPLGENGEQLHEWVIKLAAWRRSHGREGGEVNASSAIFEESVENLGAVVMGRGMFGGGPGPWGENPWEGWWGDEPPFHSPVFVLTHHEREPLEMEGGTTFYFVTGGIESAVAQAKEAAGGKDVSLAGGADVFQQCVAAGLLDELLLNVVPMLLGDGTPLFGDLGDADVRLEQAEVVAGPEAAHLKYRFTA